MKTFKTILITILAGLGLLSVESQKIQAQTYAYFAVTSGSATNLYIPTNMLVTIENVLPPNISYSSLPHSCLVIVTNGSNGSYLLQYPGQTTGGANGNIYQAQVLGPATLMFNTQLNSDAGSMFLLKYETVNVAPSIPGFIVQPGGQSVNIALETSTNLVAWSQTTNGLYPATEPARFFRLHMTLIP